MSCQYIKVTSKASKLDGDMVVVAPYTQQEHRRLSKHKQLKQANLQQRKNKPGANNDRL